jgi:hypothetical protein
VKGAEPYENPEREREHIWNMMPEKARKAAVRLSKQFPADGGARLELVMALLSMPDADQRNRWSSSAVWALYGMKDAEREIASSLSR